MAGWSEVVRVSREEHTAAPKANMSLAVTLVTSSYTITSGGLQLYQIDATNGGFTLTLPDATNQDGSHFYIKRQDNSVSNPVTISCQNNQKLDNNANTSLSTKKFFHVIAYNNNWWVIG